MPGSIPIGQPYYSDVNGALPLFHTPLDAAGRVAALYRWGVNAGTWSVSTGYGYDGISRVNQLNHGFAGGVHNVQTGLAYSPAGQITSRTRDNDIYAFNGYVSVTRDYQRNGLNQYTSAGPAVFGYDANGNLISDGATAYGYDIENRLTSASNGAQLTWDPTGRLWQTSGTGYGTRQFLYDGSALVAEYDGAGAMQQRYVHGDGDDVPLVQFAGAQVSSPSYLFTDHQGSVMTLTDANGAAVSINRYDEYGITGNTANGDVAPVGRFGYTGQAWLPELGMYHYKARIYSPTLGRFLQTDPIGYDDQINLYAYVANDPVNKTDPTGMESPCVTLNTGCGMGGFSLPSLDTVINVATVVLVGIDILDGPTPDVGAAAVAARAARAERMAANAAQGPKAEAQTTARLGDRVAGRRVTLESSTGRRSTTDFVTKEKGVVETKSGGARLSLGQRDVKADIDAGRPVTPRGQNAENAGLKPGEPTRMKCYEVDRCK